MAAGLCFALVFGEVGWIAWVADLFMRLLRMVIVPLIFTSIVHGVSGIGDGRSIGRLGGKTLLWYTLSSFMAILVGLTLANSIRPGRGLVMPEGVAPLTPEDLQTPSSMADILQRLVPDNPVGAAAGGDILGLIFFSIVLGAAIGVMTGKTGDLLRDGFSAGFEAMMKVTTWVIRLLPIGVFALLARAVSQMGLDVFQQVGKYVLTIAVGLSLHVFVVLPLLFALLSRKNPIHHYRAMASAMAMAFSTSSSAATLPMTMKCLREKVGASNRVSSFVAPMGATVNMDGTAPAGDRRRPLHRPGPRRRTVALHTVGRRADRAAGLRRRSGDPVGRSGDDLHRARGDRPDHAGGLRARRRDAQRRPPRSTCSGRWSTSRPTPSARQSSRSPKARS